MPRGNRSQRRHVGVEPRDLFLRRPLYDMTADLQSRSSRRERAVSDEDAEDAATE